MILKYEKKPNFTHSNFGITQTTLKIIVKVINHRM